MSKINTSNIERKTYTVKERLRIYRIFTSEQTLKIPSCASSPWTLNVYAWQHLELIYDRSVWLSHTALYETCKSPLANSTMARHDSAQPAHKSRLSNVSTKIKSTNIKSWTHSVPCQTASASLPSDWQENSREEERREEEEGSQRGQDAGLGESLKG